MNGTVRTLMVILWVATLSGCGGGGGGDRAAGVDPGPQPAGGPAPPDPPTDPGDPTSIDAADISPDDTIEAQVLDVSMASPPTVTFSLTVNGSLSVTGLTTAAVRWSLAELVPETNFDISSWMSFIDTPEDPVCRTAADVSDPNTACSTFTTETDPALIPDTALAVQDPVAIGKQVTDHATTETSGSLIDNGDGSWSYTYSTDPGDPAGIANMLRSCAQFSLNAPTANLCVDYVPEDLATLGLSATSLDSGFYTNYPSRQVTAEGTCNTCHADLALHGGGRTGMDYCVSCHNPGSVDANSSNPVDFKVMVHRIHYARNLDSVVGGTAYKIFGFRNGEHDFSNVSYPQDVINCTRCHAGQEDVDRLMAAGLPLPEAQITPDGYNWSSKPNPVTCLSCHEGAAGHVAGRDSCVGCHGPGEFAAVEDKHADVLEAQGLALALNIDSVTNTAAGENPVITFTATRDATPIDILNPAEFDGDIRLRVAWDAATEYLNSGNDQPLIALDAIANSVPLGGNQFRLDTVVSGEPIPAGIDTLGINGYLNENVAEGLASADSPDVYVESSATSPTPRRRVVDKANCNDCHRRLTFHAPGSRSVTDNPQVCVGCHEPNRAGRSGSSTDYSVLIHGLHASGFREQPYRSYDTDKLQFPGDLANCDTCHTGGSQHVPLPVQRVPVLVDRGGLYTTPVAAACGACHDSALSAAHMESAGGAVFRSDFATADAAVESCEVCHRQGASADVDVVHAR